MAIDSSLPRMGWAVWRHQNKTQRAARLDVALNGLDDEVEKFTITPGAVCERAEWKKLVKPGDFYVGDRYYGEDYDLLRLMSLKNCGYVVRMRQNT